MRGRDFLDLKSNGGYRFAYSTGDAGRHYHSAAASPDNTVAGRFGHRDPATGGDLETTYTAGRRGFRARGPHIHRHMDLSQNKIPYNPPVSPDSPLYNPSYSTYFDPNEDPSYSFGFQTPEYSRREAANSRGDVNGRYSYVDDVGVRHNVEYEAGSRVGFHVKTPYPDSTPLGPSVFFAGPPANKKGGKPLRGHTSIQRGKDGSYRFTSAGPDQRRTEVSDATGHVRGSYTYVDDKGVQRTTQYIAGPNIGYKVINTQTNNRYPVYPYLPPYPYLPDGTPLKDDGLFDDFNPAESGLSLKPPGGNKGGADYDSSSEHKENKPSGVGSGGGVGSHSDASAETEDPWPSDIFGPSTPGSVSTSKPNDFDSIFGKPGSSNNGVNNNNKDDDDFFDSDLPVGPHKGDGSNTFLTPGSAPPSGIPYGDCCKLGPVRAAAGDKRRSRHPDISQVRDSSQEQSVGFPPGVPIRAHVQSLDVKPFGSRIPSPGAAIEHSDSRNSQWEGSEQFGNSGSPEESRKSRRHAESPEESSKFVINIEPSKLIERDETNNSEITERKVQKACTESQRQVDSSKDLSESQTYPEADVSEETTSTTSRPEKIQEPSSRPGEQ